jgi:hypothetical protein
LAARNVAMDVFPVRPVRHAAKPAIEHQSRKRHQGNAYISQDGQGTHGTHGIEGGRDMGADSHLPIPLSTAFP